MRRPSTTLVTAAALPYLLSVPTPRDDESPLPVLFFLHGYDEGYPTPIEQALTRHGPLRASSSSAATGEFIVVAPQMPESGDFWFRHQDAVQDIVTQVQEDHWGDSRRTYLTGFSFGGNGVFDLAIAQPGLWQALWPVDPTRVPNQEPSQPIWLSSGQISRFSEERFLQRLSLEKLDPSEAEKLVPGERIYFDEGQDHVGTARLAYQDDRIYRWLLAL